MFKDQNPGHWKLLFFYYNPEQPRLWVRRRWAWGLTLGVSWMDSRKCQTATATPAEPGELPLH